jgi:hypothetical protein
MEWWDQVSLTPDLRRIIVLSKGIEKGSMGSTPMGGQISPVSMLGHKLKWKNPQKKARKKKTSDIMNHPIPHFRPNSTSRVWKPIATLSRRTSRTHI